MNHHCLRHRRWSDGISRALLAGVLLAQSLGAAEPKTQPERPPPPRIENPTGALTLRDTVALVLAHNPELAAYPFELRALEARKVQAGLRPNPELGLEVENVLGTGSTSSFREAETTLQLGQLIELGGKRLARVGVVTRQSEVAAADYEVKRVDVLSRAAAEFIHTLAAQEAARIATERVELAQRVAETIAELVANGKISPIEEIRTKSDVAAARIEQDKARRRGAIAHIRLAALWGVTEPLFTSATGSLESRQPIPAFNKLAARLSGNPEHKRWAAELARHHADLALAEARRVPDLTVGGGIRQLNGPKDQAFVFSVSLPLPVSDRKQGDREEAKQRMLMTEAGRRAAEVRILTEMRAVHENLTAARLELDVLEKEILPAAGQGLAAITEGYRAGKFSYLDLLEAQRALFHAREQQLSAQTASHLAVIELERLIGSPITSHQD